MVRGKLINLKQVEFLKLFPLLQVNQKLLSEAHQVLPSPGICQLRMQESDDGVVYAESQVDLLEEELLGLSLQIEDNEQPEELIEDCWINFYQGVSFDLHDRLPGHDDDCFLEIEHGDQLSMLEKLQKELYLRQFGTLPDLVVHLD